MRVAGHGARGVDAIGDRARRTRPPARPSERHQRRESRGARRYNRSIIVPRSTLRIPTVPLRADLRSLANTPQRRVVPVVARIVGRGALPALLAGRSAAAPPACSRAAGKRPKIGLVLSGGGARGLTHIGVLKVLEEMRMPIDYIAATSMGAIVGGLVRSGHVARRHAGAPRRLELAARCSPTARRAATSTSGARTRTRAFRCRSRSASATASSAASRARSPAAISSSSCTS